MKLIAPLHCDLERQTAEHVARMSDAIARLPNIAANHEDRIEGLEDRE